MKARLVFLFKYFLFWLFYFMFLKIYFLISNLTLTKSLHFTELLGVFWHGLRLDISATSYLICFPLLLIILFTFSRNKFFSVICSAYTLILLLIFTFLAVADSELYKFWGFRLDTTPLLYINTPKEMMSSTSWWVNLGLIALWGVLTFLSFKLYKKLIEPSARNIEKGKLVQIPVFLVLAGALIIPIRGGLDLAPINVGSAYFSENQYANHAALNVIWNLGYSFTWYSDMKNPFIKRDEKKAEENIAELVKKSGYTKTVLNNTRPNIIILILESFSYKIIEPLGGLPGIAPNINKLCKEGICFNNFYASGNRSDKGMVAILSGFPAQQTVSIIKFPKKTENLPFFTKDLKRAGYHEMFYYGGDVDFAAMRSYFTNGGIDKIISKNDFASSTYGAKWGVHDQYTFEKLFNDLNDTKQPFLKILFSLSSHEPFDVPMKTVIKGDDENHKFLNSAYYTDSCVGDFIRKMKNSKWWKNTLIIITADHGSRYPESSPYFDPQDFKIPMLWVGGVLNVNDSIVTRTGSQTDIGFTLLNQLQIKPEIPFKYSKNILDNSDNSFAYYVFNNGFGFMTDSSKCVFDNNSEKVIITDKDDNSRSVKIGESFEQVIYNEFLKR